MALTFETLPSATPLFSGIKMVGRGVGKPTAEERVRSTVGSPLPVAVHDLQSRSRDGVPSPRVRIEMKVLGLVLKMTKTLFQDFKCWRFWRFWRMIIIWNLHLHLDLFAE
jgi:hypothetical protein